VNEVSPLILNIIFATFTVLSINWILKNYRSVFPPFYIFLTLLGVIFFTPLPALIFIGMEHTLHVLVTILFVYFSAVLLSKESRGPFGFDSVTVLILGLLLPFIRYEGLFIVLVVCSLFILRKRWLYSFSLGVLAIIPVFIYGIISVLKGWFLVPTSILLKTGLVQKLINCKEI